MLNHFLRILFFLPHFLKASWAHIRDRHSVFQDTPLWVVRDIAQLDETGDKSYNSLIVKARKELTSRRNARISQTRTQP